MDKNVHSISIGNSPKVETTQCSPAGEWVSRVWYTHIMQYYSAIKRVKPLTDEKVGGKDGS